MELKKRRFTIVFSEYKFRIEFEYYDSSEIKDYTVKKDEELDTIEFMRNSIEAIKRCILWLNNDKVIDYINNGGYITKSSFLDNFK